MTTIRSANTPASNAPAGNKAIFVFSVGSLTCPPVTGISGVPRSRIEVVVSGCVVAVAGMGVGVAGTDVAARGARVGGMDVAVDASVVGTGVSVGRKPADTGATCRVQAMATIANISTIPTMLVAIRLVVIDNLQCFLRFARLVFPDRGKYK